MLSTHCRRLRFEPLEDRRLLTTLTVNTLVDENNGIGVGGASLREAVAAANTGDTINFSVTGTISLLGTSGFGQIAIGKSLTIQGPGSSQLTIRAFDSDGSNNSNGRRVFLVDDPASTLTVTISGLTLNNGDPQIIGDNDGGGAILNRENLTLNSCVLTGNFSPNGGAIYSTSNTLTLNDCTISGNDCGDGGGVLISDGSLAINRSTISNNVATNAGGGIASRSVSGTITIVDSTISGNFADEGGGGIYQYKGSFSISGTTISGNAADNNVDGVGGGGGILNQAGSLTMVNCTISGNSAGENGGGIFSNTAQITSIRHSTITGNVVANNGGVNGGGIYAGAAAALDHTIVAGNLRGASIRDDVSGTFNAAYSLVGDKRSATVNNSGGSLIGTMAVPIDPKLAALANNGGLTLTHALLSGSPALEAGSPAAVAGTNGIPQFDERGTPFSRVVDFDNVGGARIDIGAVEMTPAVTAPTLPGDYNRNHAVDASDYVLWRKTTGTSVSPAYVGADGDGNTAINSSDYTVWRSHYGNAEGEAAGAAVGEVLVVSQPRDESRFSNDGTAVAFPASVSGSSIDSSPQRRVDGETPEAAIDLALELLVVSEGANAGENRDKSSFSMATDESSIGPSGCSREIINGVLGAWGGADLTLLALRASNL